MATESVWSSFEQVLAEYPELSFEEELRLFWNAVFVAERIEERERGTGTTYPAVDANRRGVGRWLWRARRWRPNRSDDS
jgi:hypothetical protein